MNSLLRRHQTLRLLSSRNFSTALLQPLFQAPQLPAELETTPLTDAYFAALAEKHDLFNKDCGRQLQEMNQNIINNIMDRGGSEGWVVAENLDDITKDFHFDSFEQASAFCQHTAHFCNKKDHHPEWAVLNNGCTVRVRLTSHFAGNKVTRLDFELAEAMNESHKYTMSSFKMFPRFSPRETMNL